MSAFLDGDDVCAGCGACCRDTRDLKLTDADLARLPEFVPLVTRRDGAVSYASFDGPCPYLGADARCTVFEQRPFDCSLYPIDIWEIGRRQPDGTVTVVWGNVGDECPHRYTMLRRSRAEADWDAVREWVAGVSGAEKVELREHPRQRWVIAAWMAGQRLRRLVPGRRPGPRGGG